uniref:Uncharacterized protein n=1 Tax=Arundo donax TaxID=35708 RepID=A0A0A9EN96_ARUDO
MITDYMTATGSQCPRYLDISQNYLEIHKTIP